MRITGLYAALGALLVIFLVFRVVMQRRSARVGIGDGGDHELIRRVQTRPLIVHLFGITLIVGRVLHAWGLAHHSGTSPGRLIGMALTLLSMLGMALLLVWQFVLATTI